jgi:hypothetical protein
VWLSTICVAVMPLSCVRRRIRLKCAGWN